MSAKLSLPSSSYNEIVKIIKGYSHTKGVASLDDISKLTSMNKTRISANNKFLAEAGLISGGNKKSSTELCDKLGRALDHEQMADVQSGWETVLSSNEDLAGLITAVRIKGGMTCEELAAHILYVSGQKNNKENKAGANALVEIVKASGLVDTANGNITVAQPGDKPSADSEADDDVALNANTVVEQPSVPKATSIDSKKTSQVSHTISNSTPQIAINIQLHIPETDNPDVYNNLFKALKDHLLSTGE